MLPYKEPGLLGLSRCGLVVRRLAGKQKDLGSIRFGSPFSSKIVVMDTGFALARDWCVLQNAKCVILLRKFLCEVFLKSCLKFLCGTFHNLFNE